MTMLCTVIFNILKVNFSMEKTVIKMMEQEKYFECITLLSPLMFSTQDVYIDSFSLAMADKKDEKITSTELRALDVLIEACEKTTPMDVEMYFNCHYRKLKVLTAMMGLNKCISTPFKFSNQTLGLSVSSNFDIDSNESSSNHHCHLVAEEVKALSDCISQVKKVIDHHGDSIMWGHLACRILVNHISCAWIKEYRFRTIGMKRDLTESALE